MSFLSRFKTGSSSDKEAAEKEQKAKADKFSNVDPYSMFKTCSACTGLLVANAVYGLWKDSSALSVAGSFALAVLFFGFAAYFLAKKEKDDSSSDS